jgi:hypothetical protein
MLGKRTCDASPVLRSRKGPTQGRRTLTAHALALAFILAACTDLRGAIYSGVPRATPIPELRMSTPPGQPIRTGGELGLGKGFMPVCRDCLGYFVPPDLYSAAGLKELRKSPYVSGLIPWFRFPMKCFFAFTNAVPPLYLKDQDLQVIYGFSVALHSPEDQKDFDDVFITEFPALERQSLLSWTSSATVISGVTVGDQSVRVAANASLNGYEWRLQAISFRQGDVGGFVFTLSPAAAKAPQDILQIAQLYAKHLRE